MEGADLGCANGLCRNIREAGEAGVTLQGLANLMRDNSHAMQEEAAGSSRGHDFLEKATTFSACLRKHGLIRRVPGFDSWLYVASEHAGLYFVTVPAKGFGSVREESGPRQPATEVCTTAPCAVPRDPSSLRLAPTGPPT